MTERRWKKIGLKGGFCKRLLTIVIALSLVCGSVTPAFAYMDAVMQNTPEQNVQLLEQITQISEDGTKTPEEKLAALKEIGLLEPPGEALADGSAGGEPDIAAFLAGLGGNNAVQLNGEECTLDTIREMLAAPDVDLEQKVDVDGIEVTMGNLKTMVEIEDQIQKIADSFTFPEDLGEDRQAEYESIMDQLQTEGIELTDEDGSATDQPLQMPEVSMTAPSNGEVLAAAAPNSIYDHDARVSYQTNYKVNNENTRLYVTFTQPSLPYETSFEYTTTDGSATAGANYNKASGKLTFAPGETSKEFWIGIKKEDRRWKNSQMFLVQCSNAKNILFSNNQTAATITVKIDNTYDFYSYTNRPDRGEMNVYVKHGNKSYTFPYSSKPLADNPPYVFPHDQYVSVAYSRTIDQDVKWAIEDGQITDMFVRSYAPRDQEAYLTYAKVHVKTPDGADIAFKEDSISVAQAQAEPWKLGGGLRNITLDDEMKNKIKSVDYVNVNHVYTYVNSTSANDIYGLNFADNNPPTVRSVTIPAGTYYDGQLVPITVTYSEPVQSREAYISVNGRSINGDNPGIQQDAISTKQTFLYNINKSDLNGIQVSRIWGAKDTTVVSNGDFPIEWGRIMTEDNTVRNFSDVRMSNNREYAVASVSSDQANYQPVGGEAQVDIRLNTTFSQWLENEGGTEKLRMSIDGGTTMLPVDFKRGSDGNALEDTLTGTVVLPENKSTEAKKVRVELFIADEKNAEKYNILIGKYCDVTVRPSIYPSSITLDEKRYPEEGIFYFNNPPKLSFTTTPSFASLEPSQTATWSSSDDTIATINEAGQVTAKAEGAVQFTVTLQGEAGPVSATTPEFQLRDGGEPFVSMSGDIMASILTDTAVAWNTNVIYKNSKQEKDTTFTIRLYEGTDTAAALVMEETADNANSFTIPGDLLRTVSQGDSTAYTVVVSCGHPDYEEQTLESSAAIITRALPVVVRFDPLEQYFITDTVTRVDYGVTFQNADPTNGVHYRYRVTKNGAALYEDASDEYRMETKDLGLDLAPVEEGRLRDIYIVSIEAYNNNDAPSADSFILYVYNEGKLAIRADGERPETLELNNNKNSDIAKTTTETTPTEAIERLREQAKLSAKLDIDRGEYTWSNVDDQIKWDSTNNSAANINYQQGGVYSDIRDYDYSSYRPSSEFMLVGHTDGSTTITAMHAKTGETASLDVSVTTLKDKLYVFNLYPRQQTTLTYTNGAGQNRELKTNDKGEIAVYEESGIASDISLRSGTEEDLYLGTIYRSNLISSENDPSKLELYPVNSFKLRPAARVNLFLLKEDGTPYSGSLSVSGGVYKNGKYCAATELKDQAVSINADGNFLLTLDSTKFWAESSAEDLTASDQLDYVFIARTPNDEYYPLFINVDGSVGKEDAVIFAANSLVVAKVPEARKNKPFIAAQTARYPKISGAWSPVLYFNDIIGISEYADEMELKTTVVWWGDESKEGRNDVYLTDEYNKRFASQRTSAITRYPFSDLMVSENIVNFNKATAGLEPGGQTRPKVNLTGGNGSLALSQNTAFTFVNGSGIITPDQDSAVAEQLSGIQPTGYGTDTSNPNYSQGGDMAVPGTMSLLSNLNIDTSFLTMKLSPTNNPLEWRFLVEVKADFMGNDENDVMIDQSADKLAYLPGPFDIKDMIKGTFLQKADNDLTQALKTGTGKEKAYGGKIGGFYEGVTTWNAAAQKWEMKTRSGGFTYGMAAGYTWTVNTLVGPIPVTASASIGGGLEMDHKILMTTHGQGMSKEEFQNLLVTMRINAYIKSFVGMGFDITVLALKFGVFGQVELKNYNAFLNYKDDRGVVHDIAGQNTTLSGRTGIEFYLKVLFFKYRKILASAEIGNSTWLTGQWDEIENWRKNADFPSDFGGYNTDTAAVLMALSSMPEFETVAEGMFVEDRDYLALRERVWGESGISVFSLDDPNKMENLQSNSYPYANPYVSEDGNLVVFLSDGGQEDLNQTQVQYTTLGLDGTYTEPARVDEASELADSNLRFDGSSDFAVASWERQSKKLELDPGQTANEDDLNALMSSTEVCVSVYDGTGWNTQQLTANSQPDMAPVVATNGSKAIAAWRRVAATSTENISKMSFDSRDEILYRVYDGAEWGPETSLYNGTMGAVKGLSAAMDQDGNAVVTYTIDTASFVGQTDVSTQSAAQAGSENYEIAYSYIKTGETPGTPIRFTTDRSTDENPQITTAMLEGEERFVVAWYSQKALDETGDAKVGDIQMRVISGDGTLYHNFVDSIREIRNSGSVSIGNQFRFSKGGDTINDLSLVWVAPTMEYLENTDLSAMDRDELFAVKFCQDQEGAPVSISAPMPIVSAEENTKIDHFDAYVDADKNLKAILQTTCYDRNDPELQETIEMEDGGSVTLATPISAMKTATGTFENAIALEDPLFDYFSVKHDSSLPIQFSLTNSGKDKITEATVKLVGNETKPTTFELDLMPNASQTLTVYQNLPAEDTLIQNLTYTVTAKFADGSVKEMAGTIDLQIPDAGIADFETTKEENGIRSMQLNLYNRSDIELERLNGYQVKVGFYQDNLCNKPMEGVRYLGSDGEQPLTDSVLTISDANMLRLIDNGALVTNFAYTLPETGFADGDITIYAKVWIVDGDGNEVTEAYQSNNMDTVVFTDPVVRGGGNQFLITSEMTDGAEGTDAAVTVKNLALTETEQNGNLIVSLLNDNGDVLETCQTLVDGLIQLGKEEAKTFEFSFENKGTALRTNYVAISKAETDASLSSLEIDGAPIQFNPETLEYEANVTNLFTASIRAAASNPKATIQLDGGQPETGVLYGTAPLQLSSATGETVRNVINLTVTPENQNAETRTYTIVLHNLTDNSGQIDIGAPSWTNQVGDSPIIVKLQEFSYTPVSFTTQIDNGQKSAAMNWPGLDQHTVTVSLPEQEGPHTITVQLQDDQGFATTASREIIIDQTVPELTEDGVSFSETEIPLEKATAEVLQAVPSDTDGITDCQLDVKIRTADTLSGIASVTANAGGRIYTAEQTGEGEYALRVTQAFRGPLEITAYDRAGNSASVTKKVNVDDNMPMGEIVTGNADVTAKTAKLYAAVTTEDEILADCGIEYRAASTEEWTALPLPADKDRSYFSISVSGLTPNTDYVYRVYAHGMTDHMYYGAEKTFRTAKLEFEFVPFTSSKAGKIIVTVPGKDPGESARPLTLQAVNGEQTVTAAATAVEGGLRGALTIPENLSPTEPAVWKLSVFDGDTKSEEIADAEIVVQPKLQISSFTIPGQKNSSIDGNRILVIMPKSASLYALKPEIVMTPNAQIVSPTGGTVDFVQPCTYQIQLGTDVEVYTVTVKRETGSGGGGGVGGNVVPMQYLTVTYDSNNGSEPLKVQVEQNTAVAEPAKPVKDGYAFAGWYTDQELTKPFDFSTKLTQDIMLYAKWTESATDPAEQEWNNPFVDVAPDDWFYAAVKSAVEAGLMNGVSDSLFDPEQDVNRAMFITVLYRAAQEPEAGTHLFLDVEPGAYYEKAVAWASEAGIVTGVSETQFAPGESITREQIAAMLYRWYVSRQEDLTAMTSTYEDSGDISGYARDAVDFCTQKGIMTGRENNRFEPGSHATRAELAQVFARIPLR